MAINQYKNSCGKIDNFFTVDQLHNIVDVFRRLDPVDGKNSDCFGIDKNHKAYLWLNKVLLKSIADKFNPDLKLIFAMFLDCVEPFDLHHDLKDIPESQGKHFLSFLIPFPTPEFAQYQQPIFPFLKLGLLFHGSVPLVLF